MEEIINNFIQEIEDGKTGAFFKDNYLNLLNGLEVHFNSIEEIKSGFVNSIIEIFTTKKSKIEFRNSVTRLIKKNQGSDSLKEFSEKIALSTDYTKHPSGWNRHINGNVSIKVGAEIIFYLLIYENPNLLILEKEEEVQDTQIPNYPNKTNYLPYLTIFILLFLLLIFKFCSNKSKLVWREDFDKNSPMELKSAGWDFIDFDSIYWNQMRKDYLTLFTQYGEYSGFPPDSTVHNMVIRELGCTCCEITVKLVDFNPYSRYQQAAFYLLEKEKNRNKTFRYSFAASNPDTIPDKRIPDTTINHRRIFQMFIFNNGRIKQFNRTASHQEYNLSKKPKSEKEIFLDLKFQNNQYYSSYIFEDKEEDFESFKINDFDFTPYYIALACLGSGEKAKPFPDSEENIPAYFDFVEVKSCD